MREILFRGKGTSGYSTNKWVYGYYCKDFWSPQTGHGILPIDKERGGYVEVVPETVGQFTGLTDKNGKKIFEGDIVHILGNQQVEDWKNVNYNALIAFLDGGFCAIDGTIEEHGFRRYALARMDFDLEVIGNIHDNPELMEG